MDRTRLLLAAGAALVGPWPWPSASLPYQSRARPVLGATFALLALT